MMADARNGRFRFLIVWRLDRLGRLMQGNINDVLELERLGVSIVSVKEPWLAVEGSARNLRPSLRSSPWMRGAPQRGLARAMVRTSFASSQSTGGLPVRPRRDFQFQNARKPCLCQRITVSGRTTLSVSRHRAHRCESHIQKSRSRGPNRGRFERRRSRASCCRRAKFSRTRSVRAPSPARRRPAERVRGALPSSLASLPIYVQRADRVLANDTSGRPALAAVPDVRPTADAARHLDLVYVKRALAARDRKSVV